MSLQIQMLGTGSAFAKKHFNNNALIYTKEHALLIDCGITAPLALHTLDVDILDIDGILITHLHGDHTGGLEEIGFRMKYMHRRRMPLYITKDLERPLWENTLKGSMGDDGRNELADFFDIRYLEVGKANPIAPDLAITVIRTAHVPGKISYSLLFNDYFFYSADCVFTPDLLKEQYANGIRRFFHECQLSGEPIVHTGLDELLSLPTELQECIQLMHYDDNKDEFIGKTGPMTFIEQHKKYTIERP